MSNGEPIKALSPVVLGAVRLTADEASRDKEARFYFIDSGLPGIDFNREIHHPGKSDAYPEGALAIRADDDFWIVAVLPYEYVEYPLPAIVKTLWPSYADDASYTPDADTHERELYNANRYGAAMRKKYEHVEKDNRRLSEENERLRLQHPAPRERYSPRAYAANNYFIRQYENLLIASAHAFEPRPEDRFKGVCITCGLYGSDRVHHRDWLARKSRRDSLPIEEQERSAKSLNQFDE